MSVKSQNLKIIFVNLPSLTAVCSLKIALSTIDQRVYKSIYNNEVLYTWRVVIIQMIATYYDI